MIMHNIIIGNERSVSIARDDHEYDDRVPLATLGHHVSMEFVDCLTMHREIHVRIVYPEL
jgi:hypothetical protein